MSWRAIPTVVLDMPTPVVVAGRPLVPTYWGTAGATATCKTGPGGLQALPPPKPKAIPGGGYLSGGHPQLIARWSVDTLPDPAGYNDGFYWLGDRTAIDGSAWQPDATAQWGPDPGTPHAPSWHSFFPYKPSVTAKTHYLMGGASVHHPKGVNFNAHFIEHMWLDWGGPRPQPYTWVIAAMPTTWPEGNRTIHYLLDAGRNPDDCGVPRISADACGTPRPIRDGLSYRNLLAITQSDVRIATTGTDTSAIARCTIDYGERPKMFFGIYDGTTSQAGAYSPGRLLARGGVVGHDVAGQHRYYVLGRRQGVLSQQFSGGLLVFEMRFFTGTLSETDLQEQYDQLSALYQFAAYRGV